MEEYKEFLKTIDKKIKKLFDDKKEYTCPITCDLFKDPVFVNGYNFERESIENWFNGGHDTNPVTNEKIHPKDRKNLKTNFDKKSGVESFKDKVVQKILKFLPELMEKRGENKHYITLVQALCRRGLDLNPSNEKLLEKCLDCFDKTEDINKFLNDLVKTLMSKNKFKECKEVITKQKEYNKNPIILKHLIDCKEKLGEDYLKEQITLSDLYLNESKFLESLQTLEDIDMKKQTLETLLLLIKLTEMKKLEVKPKFVRLLNDKLLENSKTEKIIEYIQKLKSEDEKREETKRLIGIIEKKEDSKKELQDFCNFYLKLLEKFNNIEEEKVRILEKMYKSTPTDFVLLKKLYETSKEYYEKIIENQKKQIEKLKNKKIKKVTFKDEHEDPKIMPPTKITNKGSNLLTQTLIVPGKVKIKNPRKNLTVHRGYCCDGCRCTPIIGARYTDINPKNDFDLCEACYESGKYSNGRVFRVINNAGSGKVVKKDEKTEIEKKLKQIKEMGFYNEKLARILLKKHKGNIMVVVKELLKMK